MQPQSRRAFLANVGRGMLVASVGPAVVSDLGLAPVFADDEDRQLDFGDREPLVDLLQETPPQRLQAALIDKLHAGTTLRDLVAAAALANARKFGGHDYIGYHTFMAMSPSLAMAQMLPAERRALPILKVLYRNSSRIQETGGPEPEALHAIQSSETADGAAEQIRDAVHRREIGAAEASLAAAAARGPREAYNALLQTVEENADVHRIVLAHRVWDMLDLVGEQNAETMLRQSVRYCIDNEEWRAKRSTHPSTLLPKLLDQYGLIGRSVGEGKADDGWVDEMSRTLFTSTPEQAADAVAAALAEGFSLASLFEAISLATNQLVLRDVGRTGKQVQPGKPEGSVHGDSIGVHASDSANAWRHIAAVGNHRNAVCATILAGYQAALDRVQRGGSFLQWQPRPHADQLAKVTARDGESLCEQLDGAIRDNNQELACAITQRYADAGYDARGVLDVLLQYAISEDGALHAEKYFRTATDEFAATRPAFRWRQLVALARVTASEYGQPAPGHHEACQLLGV